jgi:hypothetical protein
VKQLLCLMALVACGESDADRDARYKREAEVSEAAEAICKDQKPNTRAGEAKGKMYQVVQRPDSSETWFPNPWKELPAPKTVEELTVVACRVSRDEYATSCSYDHGYTIRKYKVTDTITVRDAKTAKVLGEKVFEGAQPSTTCDTSIKATPGQADSRVSGLPPNEKDETDFLKTFLLEK